MQWHWRNQQVLPYSQMIFVPDPHKRASYSELHLRRWSFPQEIRYLLAEETLWGSCRSYMEAKGEHSKPVHCKWWGIPGGLVSNRSRTLMSVQRSEPQTKTAIIQKAITAKKQQSCPRPCRMFCALWGENSRINRTHKKWHFAALSILNLPKNPSSDWIP